MAQHQLTGQNYFVAAQNCHQQKSGAYTGEVFRKDVGVYVNSILHHRA
ncbi:MAG: triose-phosphate isomerase [Chitinophagaceae bacterium]